MCHGDDAVERLFLPPPSPFAAVLPTGATAAKAGFQSAHRGQSSQLFAAFKAVDSPSGHGLIMRFSWGKVAEARGWDRRLFGWTDVE
jgi:hypothetical protein